VGVEVNHRWSYVICSCIFSGGLPGDVNETDYNPHATDFGDHFGVGFVQNTTGTSGVSCYQYDVSGFSFISSVGILFLPYQYVTHTHSASAL
jgi:hypothetical protein